MVGVCMFWSIGCEKFLACQMSSIKEAGDNVYLESVGILIGIRVYRNHLYSLCSFLILRVKSALQVFISHL